MKEPESLLGIMRAYGVSAMTIEDYLKFQREIEEGEWGLAPMARDASVCRSRNEVTAFFLGATKADVLVMIDHDVGFLEGDIRYTASKSIELDAVCGAMVSKRSYNEGWGTRICDGKQHELYTDEVVELGPHRYLGGAMMALPRTVLVRMFEAIPDELPFCPLQRQWPFFQERPVYNEELGCHEMLSEDWWVCHLARMAGEKCYALMKPFTTHHGAAAFTALDGNPGLPDGAEGEMKPLDVIVLSTGHSATGYVSRLLTSAGVPCGHESIFLRDYVLEDSRYRADSSFCAVAHLDHKYAQGAKLLHLVRHPLMVVRSWLHGGTSPANDTWAKKVLEQNDLLDFEMDPKSVESLAWRWLRWNELIEKRAPAATVIRAEDRAKIVGAAVDDWERGTVFFDDPKHNQKPGAIGAPDLTWDDLGAAAAAVRAKAKEYGYVE